MNEKLERFSNGYFRYRLPELIFSEQKLEFSVEATGGRNGSFTVLSPREESVTGRVYSTLPEMKIETEYFEGATALISFYFDASNLEAGENRRGKIIIISDAGEYQIPFFVVVEEPSFFASVGKISDLNQFAKLVRADKEEAQRLFLSEQFSSILLKNKEPEILYYKGLKESSDINLAMEEFLILLNKKSPVELTLEKEVYEYQLSTMSIKDFIPILKKNWGCLKARVTSDALFLQPDVDEILEEAFTEGKYELPVVLLPDAMENGRNTGTITIETPRQKLFVSFHIICMKAKGKSSDKHKRKIYEIKLIQNYLWFRLKKITTEQYIASTRAALYGLKVIEENDLDKLVELHLNLLRGKIKETQEVLNEMKQREEGFSPLTRATYYYVHALTTREEGDKEEAIRIVSAILLEHPDEWRYLWLLFYLDERFDKNPFEKMELLRRLYYKGAKSPVLYLEAYLMLQADPPLLNKLDDFSIQVLNWARKQKVCGEKLALRFTYMAAERKKFNKLLYEILAFLYEQYKEKETLAALCSLLIKGSRTGVAYFDWFRLGVSEGVKITGLYEAYMDSLRNDFTEPLEPQIYLYFAHANDLNDKKKAFLYARLIKENADKVDLLKTYEPQMRQFAWRQLREGEINENLAILYQSLFTLETIEEEVAALLPCVMFRHEITCESKIAKGIYVIYAEQDKECYVPLENGSASVDLYSENYALFLVDENNCRYAVTIPYEKKVWMDSEELLDSCYQAGSLDERLLLALSVKYFKNQEEGEDRMVLRGQLMEILDIRPQYQYEIRSSLIRYFANHFDRDRLEECLIHLNLEEAPKRDRIDAINLMLLLELTEPAVSALINYGYEGVQISRLYKICCKMIHNETNGVEPEFLTGLCYYLFERGKGEKDVLSYLIENYVGPTEKLYEIWVQASRKGLFLEHLEERLLSQILYCETMLPEGEKLYFSYEEHGTNQELKKAFLLYMAYRYVVSEKEISEQLVKRMRKEPFYDDNTICKLAVLKYDSHEGKMSQDKKEMDEYYLSELTRLGIVLPFFQDFYGKCRIPEEILFKSYAMYIGDPEEKVEISWQITGEERIHTERMKEVYRGIFIKEFLLFREEEIQYEITAEKRDAGKGAGKFTMRARTKQIKEEGRYHLLNQMEEALEKGKEDVLKKQMEEYVIQNEMMQKLFLPLG